MRRALGAVAVLLVVLAPPAGAAEVCDRTESIGATAELESDALTEVSGVVESRAHEGILWVHNDSGGRASLWATNVDGDDLGEYVVPGVEAFDWEDIAIDGEGILIGDIGDNLAVRDHVEVHRVPEPEARPDGTGGTFGRVDTFELTYPTGPVNAEAMVLDPAYGALLVLTKEDGRSRVFQGSLQQPEVALEEIAAFDVPEPSSDVLFGLPGNLVTGADVSPDGRVVLVRTYRAVLAFEAFPDSPTATAFGQAPCEVAQAEETQGEAVAFVGDGYVTIGEGRHPAVHRFAVLDAAPPTTTTAPPVEPEAPSVWPLVALVAAVVLLSLWVAVRVSRGRAGPPRTRGSRRP